MLVHMLALPAKYGVLSRLGLGAIYARGGPRN
jgi:hypothetical protein